MAVHIGTGPAFLLRFLIEHDQLNTGHQELCRFLEPISTCTHVRRLWGFKLLHLPESSPAPHWPVLQARMTQGPRPQHALCGPQGHRAFSSRQVAGRYSSSLVFIGYATALLLYYPGTYSSLLLLPVAAPTRLTALACSVRFFAAAFAFR